MENRDFSDTVKLEVIKKNLENNSGNIQCEICGKRIITIAECHFDHIFPYAKGGKSNLSNCQILCVDCNLKKNDKYLSDFILEEKAKSFLAGDSLTGDNIQTVSESDVEIIEEDGVVTKASFDKAIKSFIDKKGNIHKVDFSRGYNHLPSIHYVHKFYGDLNNLKKAFGITDLSLNWNRDSIKTALDNYISLKGDIVQSDLKKSKGLPSLPCILKYYPEYSNFTELKKGLLKLSTRVHWDREQAIEAGKRFLEINDKVTEKDLKAVNGLPTSKVIYSLFGTLSNYQDVIGSEKTSKNDFISKEEIRKELDVFFSGRERVTESQKAFFESFKYSPSTIHKRYGSFEDFCKEENIYLVNKKKARYTKREVDDAISAWIKKGNKIPKATELTKLGLPSQSVIMKYYENWREPFILYLKIHEEANRN